MVKLPKTFKNGQELPKFCFSNFKKDFETFKIHICFKILPHIYDTSRFTWANMECVATVHCAGDSPWIRCWVGVSIAPQVGSIYDEETWDYTTQRWHGIQRRRTVQRDADHHLQYLLHGRSLQNAGCVGKPLVCMARQDVFMCIPHCIMAVGRLLMQFLEARGSDLDKVLLAGVQSVLDGACTVIRLGSAASRDGEEVYRLLHAWEQVQEAACLDATHPGGRPRELLRQLYRTYQHGPAPHCRGPASRFREHVAPKFWSHYLCFWRRTATMFWRPCNPTAWP